MQVKGKAKGGGNKEIKRGRKGGKEREGDTFFFSWLVYMYCTLKGNVVNGIYVREIAA